MKTASTSFTNTAYNLEPEGQVELFKLTLTNNNILYLSPQKAFTWLGNQYAEVPCKITGVELNSDGTRSRPKFSFANPGGIFTSYIVGDLLEGASLQRQRVMVSDLQANLDVALRETFRVTKILSVSKSVCSVELKGALDGQPFQLPARAFYPPEFPHVRLS